jgi:uncharacterized protein
MRLVEGRLVLGATDLSDFIACEHLTQLEIRRAHGEDLPRSRTPLAELLASLGGEHETRWVDARRGAGERVHEFDPEVTRSATTLAELEHAAAETAAVMGGGTEILYQPFFFDGTWQARADFLVRVDRPSALGDYSYEVYDAKLARHVRVEALLQLCEYSLQLSHILDVMPEQMHVVLGDGTTRSFAVSDFAAYHRVIRAQFQEALLGADTYPQKVAHCNVCDYAQFCDARRRADSHLSLVARMRRDQVRKLNVAGLQRVDELAQLAPDAAVTGMAQRTLDSLREQARLQVAGAGRGDDAPPLWELLPQTEPGFGLESLPKPSVYDVFFDMEGDAFTHEEPIEYLFGVVETVGGEHRYRSGRVTLPPRNAVRSKRSSTGSSSASTRIPKPTCFTTATTSAALCSVSWVVTALAKQRSIACCAAGSLSISTAWCVEACGSRPRAMGSSRSSGSTCRTARATWPTRSRVW